MPRRKTKTYPGSITRRRGAWRIRLCVGGVYHSFTEHGTRVEAQNFATTKYDELTQELQRKQAGLPGPVSFSTLLKEFTEYELPTLAEGSRRSYNDSFKPFRDYFVTKLGDPFVRQIQRSHIKTYIEWRRTFRVNGKGGVSAHTVARDRRVLHRLFNYALEKDYLDANPCQKVRAPKADPRTPPILTDAQLDDLLSKAEENPMLRMYILLLAETGARAYSEALQLQWEDVDLVGGFLHVKSAEGRRTKSGKSRQVPMTPRLRSALQDHAARFRMATYNGERSPYVFHHITSRRSCVPGARIRSLKRSFRNACEDAELPAKFRPHDLRHRRVTVWLAEGKNPVHVKEAVGHASLATTMDYTHLQPEHLRALVEPSETALKPAAAASSAS